MCGRFFLATPAEVVAQLFGVDRVRLADLRPLPGSPSPAPRAARYNIAPTQLVAVVRDVEHEGKRHRELAPLRWGLVPFWATDPSVGNRMINARGESAATGRAFKSALQRRRCLIPADGFYEWKKTAPRAKQPVAIRSADGKPLALAGLWERWHPTPPGDAGPYLETATILTCPPNDLLKEIHDRMPVILEPAEWDRWLDPAARDPGPLLPLLDPYPSDKLTMHPVGPCVNSPRNDDARCIEEFKPEGAPPPQGSLF